MWLVSAKTCVPLVNVLLGKVVFRLSMSCLEKLPFERLIRLEIFCFAPRFFGVGVPLAAVALRVAAGVVLVSGRFAGLQHTTENILSHLSHLPNKTVAHEIVPLAHRARPGETVVARPCVVVPCPRPRRDCGASVPLGFADVPRPRPRAGAKVTPFFRSSFTATLAITCPSPLISFSWDCKSTGNFWAHVSYFLCTCGNLETSHVVPLGNGAIDLPVDWVVSSFCVVPLVMQAPRLMLVMAWETLLPFQAAFVLVSPAMPVSPLLPPVLGSQHEHEPETWVLMSLMCLKIVWWG